MDKSKHVGMAVKPYLIKQAADRVCQPLVQRNNRIHSTANRSVSKGMLSLKRRAVAFWKLLVIAEGVSETSPQVIL